MRLGLTPELAELVRKEAPSCVSSKEIHFSAFFCVSSTLNTSRQEKQSLIKWCNVAGWLVSGGERDDRKDEVRRGNCL